MSTLSNGLRIVTETMPGSKSASIGLWVTAGGKHEEENQNGIAHFLEHMAFKGTQNRSALQIAEEIENVGAHINAYTSKEMTAYYVRCLGKDVKMALDVIADIVLNPSFNPEDIETERHVILQEIGQALDTPDDIIFDWLQEVSYPEQPFGRSILGSAERVSCFNRDDLKAFTQTNYHPERMILSAAGMINHEEIVTQAKALFADRPAPQAKVTETTAAVFKNGEKREIKALEQAHFTLSFQAPDLRAPDIYCAQLYATIMGGGMSSRLFQKIREEKGLCYTIFAQASASDDTGALTIYAGTSGTEIATLANTAIDELRQSSLEISDAELTRAQAQLKAGLLMGLESPSSRVERNARMLATWGKVIPPEDIVQKIDAVTCEDVHRYATQLASAPMAMALYGPVETAPSWADLYERMTG